MVSLRLSSIYTSASSAARLIVALVTSPLLVRFLGVQGYGVWALTSSLVAIVALSEFDVSSALNYYLAADNALKEWHELNGDATTSFLIITVLGGVATLGLVLASPRLLDLLFTGGTERSESLRVLYALALGLPFRFWRNWACAIEAAFLRYDCQVAVETSLTFAIQIGSVIAALIWRSVFAVAIWQSFVSAIAWSAHILVLRAIWPCQFETECPFRLPNARRIVKFGLSEWITDVGSTIFNNADRLIVNGVLGTTAVGLYSAAVTVVNKISEVSFSFTRILPPAVTAAATLGDNGRVRHILEQAHRLNGAIVFLGTSGVLFWAETIGHLILGAQYNPSIVLPMRALALIYGTNSLWTVSSWFATGIGRPLINARWLLLGSIFMCVLIRVLGNKYGLIGAAWGNVGYMITIAIVFEVLRILQISFIAIAAQFVPSLCGIFTSWVLCSSSWYLHLPIAWRVLICASVQLAVLVWIISWKLIKDSFCGMVVRGRPAQLLSQTGETAAAKP
jgi:O-antigen/teichoic acid export membrane protein